MIYHHSMDFHHSTDMRIPDKQNLRSQIKEFQEKFSCATYRCRAHDVMNVTEKFYAFLKGGLPFNRMLILRDKLITTAKAKQEREH